LPVRARDCALPSVMKALEAGLVRCALRVSDSSSSIASPEPIGSAVTATTCPAAVFRPRRLKTSVVSLIQASFSEP
jgi:hypothetical protein